MSNKEMETERICGNCDYFNVSKNGDAAIDVMTRENILSGQRSCSGGNIAWSDSPCVTGEYLPKGLISSILTK